MAGLQQTVISWSFVESCAPKESERAPWSARWLHITLRLLPFVVVLTLTCAIRGADTTARSHSAPTSPLPAAWLLWDEQKMSVSGLKAELKFLESIFDPNHERFRIIDWKPDELSCQFNVTGEKLLIIHCNITVSPGQRELTQPLTTSHWNQKQPINPPCLPVQVRHKYRSSLLATILVQQK